MAARRAPSKAREFDYSNVGKAGRRTGITLKEGKLDEDGMEEIDGMFSSPEKSPGNTNGNTLANHTMLSSEGMETGGSSSLPDPSDVLSARRAGRATYLPPPRSRSPVKSHMSGSPRRTPGIRSSPLPQSDQMSSPTSAHVTAKRALDFKRLQADPGRSPLKKVRAYSFPPITEENEGEEEHEDEEEDEQEEEDGEEGPGTEAVEEEEVEEEVEEEEDEEEGDEAETTEIVTENPADFSDDGNHLLEEEAAEESGFIESHGDYHEGGQNADLEEEESEAEEGADPAEDPSPSVTAKQSNRGRKRKATPEASTKRKQQNATNGDPVKRRGRKPKTVPDHSDDDAEEDVRPTKKAKKTAAKSGESSNIHMTTEQENDLNQVVENITKRDGPLKSRSLYILRRETPSDQNARYTRSGRASVRPLAYWRNEKCVFGNEEADVGQRFPMSTIKEIIRTDEPEPTVTKSSKRSSKKKPKKKKDRDAFSGDEAEANIEPWELQGGIFCGPVRMWDPENQSGTQEEEIMDVAYAPAAIQTHEVKDSTFRFAKILSTPFIGSGFVELPPGAVKRPKNSKRMHMVFFVYYGRINVDLSGLQFGVGKGCVFQVPRGNNYSFSNERDKPAALFYTQGCIPIDSEGNVDKTVPAPPFPDNVIPEAEVKPATKKKGKQKSKPKQAAQAKE